MSQQKVDRYKKQKNDREKIQRREKWELRLEKLAIAVVCIAMVGWIGYSAYDLVTREDPNAEQEDGCDCPYRLSQQSFPDGYRIGRNLPGKSKPRCLCLHAASGLFDSCGIRQMDMRAWPLGSLPAGIKIRKRKGDSLYTVSLFFPQKQNYN